MKIDASGRIPPKPPAPPPKPELSKERKSSVIDERHERIEVLVDALGNFTNLTNELSAEPPCYSAIMDCINMLIKTLRDAKEHLLKIKEEVRLAEDSHSDADSDPA